jgi:hypothetical protein
MPEEAAFGNIAHEKLYHHKQFVYGLVEARCKFRRRRAADGLLQVGVRRGIVELHSLDATKVVVIAGVLRVGGGSGEIRLRDELVGLVVKTVMQVTTEKTVDEGSLGFIIVTKRSSSLGCKEEARGKNISE